MSIATAIETDPQRSRAAHVREHGSILAHAERQLLIWIAVRLPVWINADHLTAIGFLSMVGAGLAFAAAAWSPKALLVVPICLVVNWFGDSLDGTVARVRQQQRPRYGYYLDHVIDLVNSMMLFVGMGCSGLMQPWLALALLAAYVMLCAESFLAAHAVGIFRISFSGIGPTELRLLLSVGALTAIVRPTVAPLGFGPFGLFDVGAAVAIAGMSIAFVTSATRNARALYLAEPLPERAR
jgi:archaetidylinositol phosphate synthase